MMITAEKMASYADLKEYNEGFCSVNNLPTLPLGWLKNSSQGFTVTKHYAKLKVSILSTYVVFHTIVLIGM